MDFEEAMCSRWREMSRSFSSACAALAVAALLSSPATVRAQIPELMERAVLPYTDFLPTCACVVEMAEGDHLVVGHADGKLIAFNETAGKVMPRTVVLPLSGAVDAVVACSPRQAGAGDVEPYLLALSGRRLFSVSYDDMRVVQEMRLAAPDSSYALATVREPRDHGDGTLGSAFLSDGDSSALVLVDIRTLGISLDWEAEPPPTGSVSLTEDVPSAPPGSVMAVTRRVSDRLTAVGGSFPLTDSHDIGWIALIDAEKGEVSWSDHAFPVAAIEPVGDFVAVQDTGRSLSIYDMGLTPLWDHHSPVKDAMLLSGDIAGDDTQDLAVVGTRVYHVRAAMVDSIRYYLDDPAFMTGAERRGDVYTLRREFVTFYVSNAGELEEMVVAGIRGAEEAFERGEASAALERAAEARGAAAVLGRRQSVAELTEMIADYESYPRRRTSVLWSTVIMAALGVWFAYDYLRGALRQGPAALSALMLVVAAGVVSVFLGEVAGRPLLFAGGLSVSGAVMWRRLRHGPGGGRVPGPAVEELILTLMEFIHGAGEGIRKEGVADAVRKGITALAYLAQEMLDSTEDPARYTMLKERLQARADSFRHNAFPLTARLVSLAEQTGFIQPQAAAVNRAARKILDGLEGVFDGSEVSPQNMRLQLEMIREGRDELAHAADEAWRLVQLNPACSARRGIDRVLAERAGALSDARVDVVVESGVSPERDAVSMFGDELFFVLENLITNAIRAMESSEMRELRLTLESDGIHCLIRVADTGRGMTSDQADGLFGTALGDRGRGFGLRRSREKLRSSSGDLILERTAPGRGTTFLVKVPLWRNVSDRGDQ
jgi:signal transduction histidine kinase